MLYIYIYIYESIQLAEVMYYQWFHVKKQSSGTVHLRLLFK